MIDYLSFGLCLHGLSVSMVRGDFIWSAAFLFFVVAGAYSAASKGDTGRGDK